MTLFVGNTSYQATEGELRSLFEEYGQVQDTVIITDPVTGQSRGYGFVSMPERSEANAAIGALNGHR